MDTIRFGVRPKGALRVVLQLKSALPVQSGWVEQADGAQLIIDLGTVAAPVKERVAELKSQGSAVLCWTVRSRDAEAKAREVAQNITFEGYAAALPA